MCCALSDLGLSGKQEYSRVMLSLNFCCIVVFSSLALLVTLTEAQYDDVRCKCVCPKESNKTAKIPNVFVRTVEPKDCTCEHIVQREEQFCLRCQCMYENRNTTLIKVVIIFILVIIAILCFYLIFLVIDSKRKPSELSITADEQQERLRSRSIRNFDQKMAKWKRTVTEQRRTIYDTRTMLN